MQKWYSLTIYPDMFTRKGQTMNLEALIDALAGELYGKRWFEGFVGGTTGEDSKVHVNFSKPSPRRVLRRVAKVVKAAGGECIIDIKQEWMV